TATDANTNSAIVARDGSGDFAAHIITATAFSGAHNGTVGATTPAAGTFTILTSANISATNNISSVGNLTAATYVSAPTFYGDGSHLTNIPAGSPADNSVTSAKILDGEIVNADINAGAAIVDTKLDTISTAGKVANSATTATDANT